MKIIKLTLNDWQSKNKAKIKTFSPFFLMVSYYLIPKVLCKKVTIPLTKNSVEMIYPLAGSSDGIQSKGQIKTGIETVPPSIVK